MDGLEKLLVPLGAIVDWYRPDGKTSVPAGFQLCDGSKIVDPYSPFSGQNTPNLIGRFTMGVDATALGQQGGRADIPSDGAHAHTISFGGYGWGEINYGRGPGHRDEYQMQYAASNAGAHNHGGDNRPPFTGVLKIMRIR